MARPTPLPSKRSSTQPLHPEPRLTTTHPETRLAELPIEANAPSDHLLAQARIDAENLDGDIDVAPKPRRAIRPVYPYGARQRGEQGSVIAVVHVSAQGTVEQVVLAQGSGYAALDRAAQEALRAARFEPARRGTTAVPARVRLTIVFQLKG